MIYVMSGGGAKVFGVIGVTYPAGSTLTCTNGTKTLTAKTTNGNWGFVVPSGGTWTVTATDGSDTANETVEITAEGQSVSVVLSYRLVIFDGENGGDNTAVTGGWSAVNGGTLNVTAEQITFCSTAANSKRTGATNNPIPLHGKKLLRVRGGNNEAYNSLNNAILVLSSRNNADSAVVVGSAMPHKDAKEVTIPLDGLSAGQNYYIALSNNAMTSKTFITYCVAE